MKPGAHLLADGRCEFIVWAPLADTIALELNAPRRLVPLTRHSRGYWRTVVPHLSPGTRYRYLLKDGVLRPDPASHSQSEGVHAASAIVDHNYFPWQDEAWRGVDVARMLIYEVHTGTFTPEGTFDAMLPRLPELRDLGVNALELMPVAAFPGARNWGYDGVYPYAVQESYGGPDALKRLVNACHHLGLAVILDVVYNHLGPEGNYLNDFGPYFTDTYHTPWGWAINFDGPHSDEVADYFIDNALHWFEHYHIDALRLDAIHAIFDNSARHFLRRLADATDALERRTGQRRFLIAESDLNDARVIRPASLGGHGLDAQWADDLHHCVHALLTGEQSGYYADYGRLDQLVKSLREGYAYTGEFSVDRRRRHGNSPADRPGRQFVVCSQNHDQVGNRLLGERLSALVSFEAQKLAGAVKFVAPFVPLLFMGEEYTEDAPFLYFVSHGDPQLIAAVRKGRREEFATFNWAQEPPDPQSPDTFAASRLRWETRHEGRHAVMLEFYRTLTRLRRDIPALCEPDKERCDVLPLNAPGSMALRRWQPGSQILVLLNFAPTDSVVLPPLPDGAWRRLLDSADTRWDGPGSALPEMAAAGAPIALRPHSIALYLQES